MKLNLHPKGIPKQEPLGADAPLKKGGVVVGMRKEGDKEKIYFVGDDCHLLCVGATRSGKSRCLVLESICLLGLAGESIFCSDPKAELFHYTADFLKKLGYEVLVLDFKNPEKSMRYNLLQPIIDAISEGDTDRAEMLAWDLTNNLVGKPEGEKIWTNGECSIIAAAILCVVCDNQKRPEFQNMTNVYWFISEMCRTIGNKMPLLEYVKKLSPSHPARALLSISDVAPSRTRGSFYTSALTTLRLFTSKSIYAITHTSDFSPTVVAAAITSRKAKNSLPTHILLENVPGLAPTSLLLLEQLRTIDRKRLRGYIGRISKEKMLEIDAALAISIGIGYPNERRTQNV